VVSARTWPVRVQSRRVESDLDLMVSSVLLWRRYR
jgi:hypothetical protein